MEFKIGLMMGGLMEDSSWHIEHIRHIEAETLDEAKDKWAIAEGLNKHPSWDSKNKIYWGWSLVEV